MKICPPEIAGLAIVRQIASAVGIRKQTLLYYFPTKDALFSDLVRETALRAREEIERAARERCQVSGESGERRGVRSHRAPPPGAAPHPTKTP